jgi:hypothetical protein
MWRTGLLQNKSLLVHDHSSLNGIPFQKEVFLFVAVLVVVVLMVVIVIVDLDVVDDFVRTKRECDSNERRNVG